MIPQWFTKQFSFFQNLINQNKLPQAILFYGQKGIGKFELGKALARYLFCQTRGNNCHCQSCTLFENGNHPDFYDIKPEGNTANIKIEQINSLIDSLMETPFGRYKAVIIDDASSLNQNAANALLKKLEEPDFNTKFFLITSNINAVLPTIKSRCQRVFLKSPKMAEAQKFLTEQNLKSEEAEALLWFTNFSPKEALKLAKANFLKILQDVIQNLLDLVNKKIPTSAFSENLKIYDDNLLLAKILFSIFYDCGKLKTKLHSSLITNQMKIPSFSFLVEKLSIEQILAVISIIENYWRFSVNNLNFSLVLDDIAVQLTQIA